MQEKLWPTMKANWVVWPLANFIAFRFLHQDVRILYANIVGVSSLLASLSASNMHIRRSKTLQFGVLQPSMPWRGAFNRCRVASLPSLV
jgi:hypothetical protein